MAEPDDDIPRDDPAGDDLDEHKTVQPVAARSSDRGGIPDDDEDYGARVRRRINKMTGALRSAETQLAEERAARVRAERALQDQRKQTVTYAGSAADQSVGMAREQLKAARASGDFEAEMAAMEALTSAVAAKGQVDTAKRQVESAPAIPDPEPVRRAPQVPEAVEDWKSRNAWFGEDQDMTNAAVSISNRLLRERGDGFANTKEYFAEINQRIRSSFPDAFEDDRPRRRAAEPQDDDDGATSPPPPPARVQAQPSRGAAPVRPAQPAAKTARNIPLTDEMKAVAKSLGISEEDYAKQALAIMKNDGFKTNLFGNKG